MEKLYLFVADMRPQLFDNQNRKISYRKQEIDYYKLKDKIGLGYGVHHQRRRNLHLYALLNQLSKLIPNLDDFKNNPNKEVILFLHAKDFDLSNIDSEERGDKIKKNDYINKLENKLKDLFGKYKIIYFTHAAGRVSSWINSNEKDYHLLKDDLENIISTLYCQNQSSLDFIDRIKEQQIDENKKKYDYFEFQLLTNVDLDKELENLVQFQLCRCDKQHFKDFKLAIDLVRKCKSSGKYIFADKIYPTIDVNNTTPKPIIIIAEKPLKELMKPNQYRWINYFDSGIWLKFATDAQSIEEAKQDILKFYKLNLYQTENAIEILNFKARMAINSYLTGEHINHVAPFKFHSERRMNELVYKVEKPLIKKINNISQNLMWRLLIIDDHAFVEKDNEKKVKKCQIIHSVLKTDFNLVCENKNNKCNHCYASKEAIINRKELPVIYVDCATTKDKAIQKLEKKRYDIILLDYLLKNKKGNKTSDAREYGTEFLNTIKERYETYDDKDNSKGPSGKFWIFFISAFTNAISEKMTSEGMHYNIDYWHIARGACPTTTPELFRYNFYSLQLQQLQQITNIGISNRDVKIITLLDLLRYIYKNKEQTRTRAMENFNSLLHLRAHYNILKKDYYYDIEKNDKEEAYKNGSPLVQTLFPDVSEYSNSFWEHTQHLVYLTAFGTVLQWPEMWEEYIFIKERLSNAENKPSSNTTAQADKKQTAVTEQIKEYIISVKNK